MATLVNYYPHKAWIGWGAYGTIAYMIATVSVADDGQMHWFSDAVAGSLMGYAIGSTVGKHFREQISDNQNDSSSGVYILPIIDNQKQGFSLCWSF